MIQPIEKEITVTEIRAIGHQIYCDECQKLIADSTVSLPKYYVQYWEVTTGHYDCGNDSCESIEIHHYCSRDCLKKAFDKYIEQTENQKNSRYFEAQNYTLTSDWR